MLLELISYLLLSSVSANTLNINLNNYASAVDSISGVTQANMTITDILGGVRVSVKLDAAQYWASTGGKHITLAWNLNKIEGPITGLPVTPTFKYLTNLNPPGCSSSCGTYTNGLQGNWNGTSNYYSNPFQFNISGINTLNFINNNEGFVATADVLGPNGTGQVAGEIEEVSAPIPGTGIYSLLFYMIILVYLSTKYVWKQNV